MRKLEFIYSGPLLLKLKVSNDDIVKIKKFCSKKKSLDWRKGLAGIIDNEYKIANLDQLSKILTPYLDDFVYAHQKWYVGNPIKIKLRSAWVNYMVAGECNPLHIHDECNFSSVMYLNVPKDLKKESTSAINNGTKPGEIAFYFYHSVDGFITQHNSFPEVGDFYIFPALLPHAVTSFKSKGERISLACNFTTYYD